MPYSNIPRVSVLIYIWQVFIFIWFSARNALLENKDTSTQQVFVWSNLGINLSSSGPTWVFIRFNFLFLSSPQQQMYLQPLKQRTFFVHTSPNCQSPYEGISIH